MTVAHFGVMPFVYSLDLESQILRRAILYYADRPSMRD